MGCRGPKKTHNTHCGKRAAQKGSSMVEMLMVLCLIAVFGVSLVSVIVGGADAYGRIGESITSQNEARIALSFINVKLRQFDTEGKISVHNSGGMNALRFASELPGEQGEYAAWVFFEGGALYECMTLGDALPEIEISDLIAEVEDCRFKVDGNSVLTSVAYTYAGETREMSSMVTLRAGEVLQ